MWNLVSRSGSHSAEETWRTSVYILRREVPPPLEMYDVLLKCYSRQAKFSSNDVKFCIIRGDLYYKESVPEKTEDRRNYFLLFCCWYCNESKLDANQWSIPSTICWWVLELDCSQPAGGIHMFWLHFYVAFISIQFMTLLQVRLLKIFSLCQVRELGLSLKLQPGIITLLVSSYEHAHTHAHTHTHSLTNTLASSNLHLELWHGCHWQSH